MGAGDSRSAAPPKEEPPAVDPGDRTEKGRELKLTELRYGQEKDKDVPLQDAPSDPARENVQTTYIKRAQGNSIGGPRVVDGAPITFRTAENGDVQAAELGDESVPWALEVAAQRMNAGDIVDVVGRGEHAFADNEEVVPETERRWRFELLTVEASRRKDKFAMDADNRIDRANELRLKGNEMFKRNRLLRAMSYYERGSSLLDVLEAEDLGSGVCFDKEAAKRNLMHLLESQEAAAEKNGVDEATFCRQREALYNQFIAHGPRD